MHPAQVAATVRGQIPSGIFLLFTVAEQRAVEAANRGRPGQLHEGFWLGDTDQFCGFGAIAQIVARAVGEQVDRCAVNQLEALLGDGFPVIGRDTLTHDLAGDRDELKVQILDPLRVDHLAHLFDFFVAPGRVHEPFQIS